jgi:hypothetical protein
MTYSHDDICAKLQGVKPFDPPENLMGARGEPVIAKICAANNISMQQPQPAAAPVAPQADWKQVLGQ